MILDDENILQKRIEKIANNPLLILKQFLIENKADKDFLYYDLKYELGLNLILNKIPIEKYGYNWEILASQINITNYITLSSGIKYANTIATIKIDESDRLKIYIETKHHKYDEIVKLLKQYMLGSYETIHEEYTSIFLI